MSSVIDLSKASERREETSESTALVQVIERAARDPSIDIDKMERLLAMQERIFSRNAEIAFNDAMRAVQADMPRILRDADNQQTSSKYARLETINKKIIPVYTAHGFSLSFGTDTSPLAEHIRITCVASHVGGHSRTYQADIPLDIVGLKGNPNKTKTHATGSTMSYGRRYLTLLIFNVQLTNDDNDGNHDLPTLSEEQVANLKALLTEVGANQQAFLRWAKVDSLGQILASNYQFCMEQVERKRHGR